MKDKKLREFLGVEEIENTCEAIPNGMISNGRYQSARRDDVAKGNGIKIDIALKRIGNNNRLLRALIDYLGLEYIETEASVLPTYTIKKIKGREKG